MSKVHGVNIKLAVFGATGLTGDLRASAATLRSVRLPNITDGPERPLRISADGRGIGPSITAASAALFLLDQATAPELVDSTPSISN